MTVGTDGEGSPHPGGREGRILLGQERLRPAVSQSPLLASQLTAPPSFTHLALAAGFWASQQSL